jgi:hypothetical protein
LVRLAGYRQLVLDLVIFDRSLGFRSEDSVDRTGIDPESPKSCLNRSNFVVAELEIVTTAVRVQRRTDFIVDSSQGVPAYRSARGPGAEANHDDRMSEY